MTRTDKVFSNLVHFIIALAVVLAVYNKITFKDSIHNPANEPYLIECAFNLGCQPNQVSQKQFNQRYNK